MSRAHISVKHENIKDAEIDAKIAFIPEPKFVKGEVIGIGNGAEQTVILKNTNKVCLHNFKIYFDDVETSDYVVKKFSGTVAVLNFALKQNSGGVTNEVLGTGTGNKQGFRLEHQAIQNSIYIVPSTATFEYKSDSNILLVTTAQSGETIKISYNWKGKEFKVDSWAGIFSE